MSLRLINAGLLRHAEDQAKQRLAANEADQLRRELQYDLAAPVTPDKPLQPLPVKLLLMAGLLMIIACAGVYLLTPKWQALRHEQQRVADPLAAFYDENTQQKQLVVLQEKIRANPNDSVLWASLGEYYLYQNAYDKALEAYHLALSLRGENAELYSALATVLYYQAGQSMTLETRSLLNKALALDENEVTALMLLASEAFTQADYIQAASLWQKLLDLNTQRVNRAQLIEAINMAKLLQHQQK
ncbi:heme lyase NrfEFG subunit NrfG [Buttiauxella warmboldiae]|uniref:Heme lyase NrfEFG subunit NrfG n=1 Tax=Buttiauxella warmboldiae TaxID=82993 RepID=A0A3N5DV76_9ENTR|nr:heme lyase NrfEFG subunit NrfG [Buttiauxella warmboldiae]